MRAAVVCCRGLSCASGTWFVGIQAEWAECSRREFVPQDVEFRGVEKRNGGGNVAQLIRPTIGPLATAHQGTPLQR